MLLGKRKEPIECILMLKDELREWKQQGKGEVHLGNIESNSFVLFTSEDGSEMCWKVEEEKRFSWNRNRRVTFYCDAEQVHRAFEFADLGLAEEFWASLQTTLRLETENENVGSNKNRIMWRLRSRTCP